MEVTLEVVEVNVGSVKMKKSSLKGEKFALLLELFDSRGMKKQVWSLQTQPKAWTEWPFDVKTKHKIGLSGAPRNMQGFNFQITMIRCTNAVPAFLDSLEIALENVAVGTQVEWTGEFPAKTLSCTVKMLIVPDPNAGPSSPQSSNRSPHVTPALGSAALEERVRSSRSLAPQQLPSSPASQLSTAASLPPQSMLPQDSTLKGSGQKIDCEVITNASFVHCCSDARAEANKLVRAGKSILGLNTIYAEGEFRTLIWYSS